MSRSDQHSKCETRGPRRAGEPATAWLLWLLRVRTKLAAACGLLLLPHALPALDPARSIHQYNFHTWTRQDGLPGYGVNAIAQTKDGFLWLGTVAGPVRFDGIDFNQPDLSQAFQFRSTGIRSLSASQQGGLWLGLAGTAFAYGDGKGAWSWGKEEWGGVDRHVNSIVEVSNGDVWIAAQNGAGRLTAAKTYEAILPAAGTTGSFDVHTSYEDSRGRIWLGTSRQGLYFWADGVLTKFPDSSLDEGVIRAVVEDRQGRIWVGSENGSVCYDSNFRRLPTSVPATGTSVFLVDRQGALWIGTQGSGLIRHLDGVTTQLRKIDGLADDFITALAEDHEGSLWVGTRSGLSQLSDVKIPTFGPAEGLTNVNVSVRASRQGGLWLATSGGFTYFDGGTKVQAYSADLGLGNAYIITLLEAKNGDIYLVNGAMELLVFSGGKIVARHPNKTWPTALAEDAHGVVMAVDEKLWRVNSDGLAPYLLADGQHAAIGYVFNLLAGKDGSIWGAAAETGIVQVKDGKIRTWPVLNGAAVGKVMWLGEDETGVIWAASTEGLARLKNGDLRLITRAHGLLDNVINAAVLDDHGSFWVNAEHGIYRVSRQSLNDFADGKTTAVPCEDFSRLNDVKSLERNQQKPSGAKTLDGRIWFPTALGVVMIDPTRLESNPLPPQVHIDVVRANGRELTKAGAMVVPPGKGELEFRFTALSFVAPQKIQFRYRLEGYDKDWVGPSERRMAFYTNLRPGHFVFRVMAANADGVWSEVGESLAIELRPQVYQTKWFYALCAAAVLAAFAMAHLWRNRLIERKQQALRDSRDRLEIQVTHRTSELADANSSLQTVIEDQKRTQAQLLQQKQSLEKEIEEGRRLQREIERVQGELLKSSRQAGMAEVATGVLHNVGNVLNSANVSVTLVADRVRRTKSAGVAKLAALFEEHRADLAGLMTQDRGQKVPGYLRSLAESLASEQKSQLVELDHLRASIDHIKDIVAMQQSYAKTSGFIETVAVVDLVEDALRMNVSSLLRHDVELVRDFQLRPTIETDKHQVLQILVNLVANAKQSCDELGRPDKRIVVRTSGGEGSVTISVTDNGVGVPAENLARIFNHGFTTKKNGHGFGLHSGALAAKELGGSLNVRSDGPGCGATFVLELPLKRAATADDKPAPSTPSVLSAQAA